MEVSLSAPVTPRVVLELIKKQSVGRISCIPGPLTTHLRAQSLLERNDRIEIKKNRAPNFGVKR